MRSQQGRGQERQRGAGSRVVVLDENASIQAERETFTHAFGVTHAGFGNSGAGSVAECARII